MIGRNSLIGGFLIFSASSFLACFLGSLCAIIAASPTSCGGQNGQLTSLLIGGSDGRGSPGGLMGQHALIADPDPTRAAIYAGILKQDGLIPFVVKDSSTVMTTLSDRGPPAIAIVDLALGIEVVERVRRAAPSTVLPIIVVSALRTERDLATVHRARLGISAILAKAASEDSIRRVVRRLLGIATGDEGDAPPPSPAGALPLEAKARADSGIRRCDDGTPVEERPPVPGKTSSRR